MTVFKASTQKEGGREAFMSRVRTMLLVERMVRSAFPFWGDVWGHERRSRMPCVRKKERGIVIEFFPIVTLDGLNATIKLS